MTDRDESSAEDLDEDQLRVDPLEAGMEPPEHWSAADRRGMTAREQAEAAPLDERLAEEQPESGEAADAEHPAYDESLGTSADVAGGSMAEEIRTPHQT